MHSQQDNKKTPVTMLAASIGLALQLAAMTAAAQQTPADPPAEGAEPAALDKIEVVGFRASLIKALDEKRDSAEQIDAIVAEDIGKFPDQNLAESLRACRAYPSTATRARAVRSPCAVSARTSPASV